MKRMSADVARPGALMDGLVAGSVTRANGTAPGEHFLEDGPDVAAKYQVSLVSWRCVSVCPCVCVYV
jgi:hypothetical protein